MPLLTIADLNQPQQNIDQYVTAANSLSQMYFDYIAGKQDEGYSYTVEHHGSGGRAAGIHASEISNCLKLVVYSILGVQRWSDPGSADVNMLMRFDLGTAVHAMVQNDWNRIALKAGNTLTVGEHPNCSVVFEDEVRIHPGLGGAAAEWDLHSACDGIFTFYSHLGHPVLRIGLEIKTESDKQYEKLTQPRGYHKEQTTLYMAALDLPLMWTFYYNKSNSNITTSFPPYLFQFDPRLWEALEMRFAKAHHLASIRQLPQGTEGMYCKWCSYSYDCKPAILKGTRPKRTQVTQGMKRRAR